MNCSPSQKLPIPIPEVQESFNQTDVQPGHPGDEVSDVYLEDDEYDENDLAWAEDIIHRRSQQNCFRQPLN